MKRGALAPEFELLDQYRVRHRLSTMLRSGPIVLFFYPEAMSSKGTKEACYFRDLGKEFDALGAQRAGVSPEPAQRNRRFSDLHSIEYPLLSDPTGGVIRAYGAWRPFTMWNLVGHTRRHTCVIDVDGRVLLVIKNEWTMSLHADLALEALRTSAGSRRR